ncbi:MAG: 4-hydroxy-tetrahydrodipicolinate reductase [Saprospiraceae bacterium]
MNIAIIGDGKMASSINSLAENTVHNIIACYGKGDIWKLDDADIVIEVTLPESAVSNIEKLAELKKDMVIVTTGWYDQMNHVTEIIEKNNIRAIWASNFSIGVNFYLLILKEAARLFNNVDNYDVWGTEVHHKNKIDSPSGTAKTIENIILNNFSKKKKIVEDRLNRKIADNEFHFSSTRGGTNNFEHKIVFDSDSDKIELIHRAINRNGYGEGVILASEWLTKQKPGFYSIEDLLQDFTGN